MTPSEKPKWTDVANLGVSVALLVCAGTAGLVSYWQWQAASDQLAFAVKSARESGEDTRKALRLSNRLAAAAEMQSVASQAQVRAYLKVESLTFELHHDRKTASISLSVTNGGLTPASDIRIEMTAILERNPKREKFTAEEWIGTQIFSKATEQYRYTSKFEFSDAAIPSGKMPIILALTIGFSDVFDQRRRYWIVGRAENCSMGVECAFGIANIGITPDNESLLHDH